MSPWLSDSEVSLFCKDPLISSLEAAVSDRQLKYHRCPAVNRRSRVLQNYFPWGSLQCWTISVSRSDMIDVSPLRNVQTSYKALARQGHPGPTARACLWGVDWREVASSVAEWKALLSKLSRLHHGVAVKELEQQNSFLQSNVTDVWKSNT